MAFSNTKEKGAVEKFKKEIPAESPEMEQKEGEEPEMADTNNEFIDEFVEGLDEEQLRYLHDLIKSKIEMGTDTDTDYSAPKKSFDKVMNMGAED